MLYQNCLVSCMQDYLFSCIIWFYSLYLILFFFIVFISIYYKSKHNIKFYRFILGIIMFSVIITIIYFFSLYPVLTMYYESFTYLNNHFIFNYFILSIQIFILFVFLCVLFVMWFHPSDDSNINLGAPILMLICVFASLLLITVNDLFVFYLIIELQSFSLYLLVGIKRNSHIASNTSMKYFVYGAFVSCMIAYGISLVFGSIGTVEFDKISLFISSVSGLYDMPVLLFIGLLLILGGFFFKLGVVPFHGWLPEIYEGAPLYVTFFLAIIPKVSVIFVLCRSFSFVFDFLHVIFSNYSNMISSIVICCALLSILLVL